ncbi:MAG: hypothetical protein KDE55_11240, partial [Novosphingobium sp.]|nr:hypothetical protein [Novosphingobium sp.]
MDASAQDTPRSDDSPARLPSARETLLAGIVLSLLAGLPYLVAQYPQLTDYPSHLARYHVMLDRAASPFLKRYYDFEWILAGNLGADLLMVPLGKMLGVETAAWLIGFLIPPLTGLAIVTVEWTLRRRVGVGALLALATVWSPAMGMGFYNFCLSLALALFAFALWVKLDGRTWRAVLFIPLGLAIWLCHLAGWGVLGVMVFGYEWDRRKNLSALLAPWPLFFGFVPLLLTSGSKGGLSYGANVMNYKIGIWLKALREQSMQLDLLTLLALVSAILIAARLRRIDGRLGWAALILAALTLAVPRHLGGGDFADWRLIAVALLVGCLAIDWKAPRWAFYAVSALFLVRLGFTTVAWHDEDRELQAAIGALDHIPQGARVAGAVVVDAGEWGIVPFEHAPSYATVYRDALVNSHFALPGIHMLQLREGGKD